MTSNVVSFIYAG